MGLEAKCVAKFGKEKQQGLARLEEKELQFKGAEGLRLKIPLSEIKVAEAKRGVLTVKWSGGAAALELGAAAEKWALKIRYPRSRMDKLGVKPGMRVSVLGVGEKQFWNELEERGVDASDGKLLLPTYKTSLIMKNRDFFKRIGVTATETFAPGDMELEPGFQIVAEWADYRRQVTPFELERYLPVL